MDDDEKIEDEYEYWASEREKEQDDTTYYDLPDIDW